jgi:hypothetical protein
MYGDRDNPDQQFSCQSEPRNDCVVPASRPDAPVFSTLYIYYHGSGEDTTYTGSFQIGYFNSHEYPTNITVKKNESIANQSVTGIVTSMPGTYEVAFNLTGVVPDTKKSQPIQDRIRVLVR